MYESYIFFAPFIAEDKSRVELMPFSNSLSLVFDKTNPPKTKNKNTVCVLKRTSILSHGEKSNPVESEWWEIGLNRTMFEIQSRYNRDFWMPRARVTVEFLRKLYIPKMKKISYVLLKGLAFCLTTKGRI